jgi:hypothetical protein
MEKELVAVILGMMYFRPYLYGRRLKIISDY